jgi:uncharacterized protein
MSTVGLLWLVAAFFLTSAVSVVTGGTSLLTVPVMICFGVEPRVAVATNMFALIFLSIGGTLPFLKGKLVPNRQRLSLLMVLTLVGSLLGAWLLLVVPPNAMPLVIAAAMIIVAMFPLTNRKAGLTSPVIPSRSAEWAGLACTFLLGIYGGFFSGGYVAMLTAAFVAFFRLTFLEAVALTKVLNVLSSLVATLIFAHQGLVDWQLGLILSGASFAGAFLGAGIARKASNLLLRRIFVVAVIAMAIKTLLLDVSWEKL